MSMTHEENDLMTQVQGVAPMGQMLREYYWFPATLSQKLEADGPPQRVRLVGENFVAWRSTDGRVGFFSEYCPHRRVSLALARNEDNALRCIFHGWKFSVTGEVVEVPTEPHNATEFCKGVPLKHYPAREAAGIVWVWLGAGAPAMFPEFEFMKLPPEQVYPIYQTVQYNWVQSVEGNVDAAHVTVLHQDWLGAITKTGVLTAASGRLAPVYELENRNGGFRYAAIRDLGDGRRYVRVTEYVMPWYTFIASEDGGEGDRSCIMSVPIDDDNAVYWTVRFNPFRPLGASHFNPVKDPADWPPYITGGPDQRWGQDRAAMQNGSFSGFRGHVVMEDFAVTESQGSRADRSGEYLGAGDRAIARARNVLLNAVKQYQKGQVPKAARHEEIRYGTVRALADIIPDTTDWRLMKA
jgi:phthalate 4,5-dioxygenase